MGPSFAEDPNSSPSLKVRLFAADGTPRSTEITVATPFNRNPPFDPAIAALADGGFLVSWTDPNFIMTGNSSTDVIARRYDQSGQAVSSAFVVNSILEDGQVSQSIAALKDGGFVLAWEDGGGTRGDGSFSGISARRFDAAGTSLGDDFQVNTTTLLAQMEPDVASLAGGGFVIAWTDGSHSGPDDSSNIKFDIRAQIYDATGTPAGAEFVVNTTVLGFQDQPAIAALADGGFVISWTDNSGSGTGIGGDTSGDAVRAQRFEASGARRGGEFLVNTVTHNDQLRSDVAVLAHGGFAIAWQDNSGVNGGGFGVGLPPDGDFSGSGVRAALFDTPGPTTLFSSVLPGARSGFVGGAPVTVFASAINAGGHMAQNCTISIDAAAPVSLNYQQTDQANQPTGPANQPFDMSPQQTKSFVLSFSPLQTSAGIDLFPDFVCDVSDVSPIAGVNTVFVSIDDVAAPDILSISATPDGNGIISITAGGASFMSVSATNIGAGDAPGSQDAAVVVTADDGGKGLPLLLQWCETDAAGTCISALGSEPVSTTIGPNPSFFAVFAFDQGSGGLPLDPANARVFLRFTDAGGTIRSVTSAAVSVQ